MEIEYQNKYVVTWCLDRKGPRICLKAIKAESQLRTIEINSKSFNLELEDAEAKDFLSILNQIVTPAKFVSDRTIATEQLSAPDAKEEIVPKVIPPSEKPVTTEVAPEVKEPMAPEVPDSSEIIQVLKESERTYGETTPISSDASIAGSPQAEEPTTPKIHETEKEETKEKTSVPESLPHYERPEAVSSEIETASFFQESVSKSPLEMLLEEDEERKEVEDVSEASISESEEPTPVESKTAYSPEDLQTEAFFSHFDTKRTTDLLEKSELKSEPEPEPKLEPEPDFERVVKLEPTPKFVKKEPVKTEAERRAEIEKERAERRRRLWELTRGF